MLARLKSEIAYARGILRALARTRPIVENRNLTLGDYLERWAKTFGDRAALLSEAETFTYRQLDARANRYARWARAQGFGKGDAICLMMANRPEYVAIWLGMARAGVATALINTNLAGPSLAHSIAIVGAKAAIVEAHFRTQFATGLAKLDAPPPVFVHGAAASGEPRLDLAVEGFSAEPLGADERPALSIEDPALFIYTSGTTGLPKAARITHSRALRIMHGFAAAADARADDRIYVCLPMYHTNGGVIAMGIALTVGGSCYIRERFSAHEFWTDTTRRDCTMFIYVGELCRYLQNTPPGDGDRAHRIRTAVGNGLRPDIFAAFKARFAIPDVLEFYAATEGNVALFNFDSHPGAVGRLPGWAAKRFPIRTVAFDVDANVEKRDAAGHCRECGVDEPGELLGEILDDPGKPAAKFDGYCDPVATRAKILRDVFKPGDAWFRTGDLLKRDARGYYYFVDRIGDTFRWKGENVSTTEVAETISAFPGVLEATVYGVAVPGCDGRAGMAAVVVDNAAEFDLAGLRAALAERLPAYARPLFLRFRPKLDLTGTFKPRKVELVAQGFDPERGGDPVYFDDRRAGLYARVDADFVAAAKAGGDPIVIDAADGPTALVEAVDRRDLLGFEAAWRDLAARAGEPNVFAEADFVIPALQRLANARVRTLLVWRDAKRDGLIGLAAVAPPRLPFGLASLWRSEQAALPAILLDGQAATEALAAIVDALGVRAPGLVGLRLPFSTVDGPVAAAAAALAARRSLILKAAHSRRRAALVVGVKASFEARLDKRRRKEWARQRRRLEELGPVESSVGANAASIEGFLAVENSGWKGARRSALDAHAERAAFARETMARFAARGALEYHSLTLKDEPIAAAAVLRAGDRAFYWKTAYDERFAAYSPGVQATLELSRRLERDQRLSLVDSCAVADHPMIDRAWRDRIELVDLALSLKPGGGAAFALATAAAHGIERLKRRARRLADATSRLSRA